MNKKQLLKTASIVVFCVLLDIALHAVTSAYSTMPENADFSKLVELFGIEITAALWALLAFSGAAYIFHRVHSNIPGAGKAKGLRYGSAISLLWLFAMLEGVSLFGNPIINEFVVGLSDAIPVFLMGVLLNRFIVKRSKNSESERLTHSPNMKALYVFAGIFLIGRYIAYFTGLIKSGYQTSPLYTFLWTLLMGICIGAACILLENTGNVLSVKRKATRFGFFVFGVNWATFLVFMPLLFSGYIMDVLIRIILDIFIVTIGYLLVFNPRAEYLKEINPNQIDYQKRGVYCDGKK